MSTFFFLKNQVTIPTGATFHRGSLFLICGIIRSKFYTKTNTKVKDFITKKEKQKVKKGIRIFIDLIFEFKKQIIILIILNILVALGDSVTPIISGKLFDGIANIKDAVIAFDSVMPKWTFYLVLWLVVQLVFRIVGFLTSRLHDSFQRSVSSKYEYDGIKRLFYLPLPFHKENKMGSTVSRIAQAAGSLEGGFEFIFQVLPEVITIIFGFAFTFYIKWQFGIMLLVATAIYAFYAIKVLRPTGKTREDAFRMGRKSRGVLYDAIGNIKTTKQSCSEEYEQRRFATSFFKQQKLWLSIQIVSVNASLFQKILVLVLQGSVFLMSIYYIQAGTMTIGSLVAVNAYLAMTFGPITYMTRWWKWLADCFVALEAGDKIFKTEKEIYEPESSANIKSLKGDIEFQNVHFSYKGDSRNDQKDVLRGVSFKIKSGETVALVGASGVGKTTIADLISAYYFPQKGNVFIDGVDIKKIKLKTLRKNIGLVSQEISIFNESIKYNIKYGNFDRSDKEVVKASKEAGAHEFVQEFKKKYNQVVGERGVKLSGGQRQRVAIAQAILKDAKILVLDEPTSALDAKTESVVAKSLDKLMKGRTTIIIAHRLATVRKADKIIVLEKGKIVEEGKHKDLIKKKGGAYRKFYELQKI